MNVTGRRLAAYLGTGVLSVALAVVLVQGDAVGAYDEPNKAVAVERIAPVATQAAPVARVAPRSKVTVKPRVTAKPKAATIKATVKPRAATIRPKVAVKPRPAPAPKRTAPAVAQEPNEDEPGWNCMTMGNKVCGPAFIPVTQELGDALAEGDDATATTRDWESCMVHEGDTTFIVCPDGYTETS